MDIAQEKYLKYLANRCKVEDEIQIIEVVEDDEDPSIRIDELINRLEEIKSEKNDIDFESEETRFITCDEGLYLAYQRWETFSEYCKRKKIGEEVRMVHRKKLKRDIELNFNTACEIIEEIRKEKNL